MIGIVNQHYGDFQELIDNIENYLQFRKSDQFVMVLVIDQVITDEQKELLDQYQKPYLIILYHNKNLGLSWARNTAIEYFQNYFFDCEQIIFSSTNSRFIIPLDDSFADLIYQNDGLMLLQCRYNKNIYVRDTSIIKEGKLRFDTFLNCTNKPDMAQVCKFDKLVDAYRVVVGEKYYVEDSFLYKCCKDGYLNMTELIVWDCWYNEKGLSNSFSRKFVLNNRIGFLENSLFFIDLFLKNEFNLGYELLRRYVTNIVTLSDVIPLKEYRGTLIYPLILERIHKWCNDDNHDHCIRYIE